MDITAEEELPELAAGEAAARGRLISGGVPAPQARHEPAERSEAQAASEPEPPAPGRLVSIDAYRGLVMVLMVSAGLGIPAVVRNFERTPGLGHLKTPLWEWLAFHTDHVPWVGCSLWDLIQPSFMFLVGTALAFSLASRRARGQSFGRMLAHAVVRSAVLVFLGIFLISNWSRGTEWTFTNVLTQIGLGYTFLFLVAWLKPRWQFAAAAVILVAYWAAFATYNAPAPAPDAAGAGAVSLPAGWQRLEGFASHWEKHANPAARFDRWLLNLFPREGGKPFVANAGGYATLNFVPSLATMIFGLLAGELLRSRLSPRNKLAALVGAGVVGLASGLLLGALGICPVVKRIWTPSWALYSAGWTLLLLAFFYAATDVARLRRWALPLVVVGMNSIAIYCISMLLKPWVRDSLRRHFGANVFDVLGKPYVPMVEAAVFLLLCWGACWWMYRKRVFVKI